MTVGEVEVPWKEAYEILTKKGNLSHEEAQKRLKRSMGTYFHIKDGSGVSTETVEAPERPEDVTEEQFADMIFKSGDGESSIEYYIKAREDSIKHLLGLHGIRSLRGKKAKELLGDELFDRYFRSKEVLDKYVAFVNQNGDDTKPEPELLALKFAQWRAFLATSKEVFDKVSSAEVKPREARPVEAVGEDGVVAEVVEAPESEVEDEEDEVKDANEGVSPVGYEWREGKTDFEGDDKFRKELEDGIDAILASLPAPDSAFPAMYLGADSDVTERGELRARALEEIHKKAASIKSLLAAPGEQGGGMYGTERENDYTQADKELIKKEVEVFAELVELTNRELASIGGVHTVSKDTPTPELMLAKQREEREAERQVWLAERGRTGTEGERYDRTIEEWKDIRKEADKVSKIYSEKLKSHYDSYYERQGNRSVFNPRKLGVGIKNFLGIKPTLTPELQELKKRDEYLQGQYAALGGLIVEHRKRSLEQEGLAEGVSERTERVMERYHRMLERKIALRPIQERIEMQKKAFETMPQNKTYAAVTGWMRKHPNKTIALKVVGYGAIGAVTGGIAAGFAAAGRVGAGAAGGMLGGVGMHRLMQGRVNRAEVISASLLAKKMSTLSAAELRQRRSDLIEAYTIKDKRLRDQRVAALAGAIAGGIGSSYGSGLAGDAYQRHLAMTTENTPSAMTEGMTGVPDSGSQAIRDAGVSVPEVSQPAAVASASDMYPEASPSPADVAAVSGSVPDLEALRGMEGGVTPGHVEAVFDSPETHGGETNFSEPEAITTEVLPSVEPQTAVSEINLNELERSLGIERGGGTPELGYTSAERLANQEHLLTLGDQFGKNTVSEQLFEAWKAGQLEHLQWVPSPDEISKQEFLDRMNNLIDKQSPNALTPDEIRGMRIESGDFHKMPADGKGQPYNVVPLLDKMFPHSDAATMDSSAVSGPAAPEESPAPEVEPRPRGERVVATSLPPVLPITETVLPPPATPDGVAEVPAVSPETPAPANSIREIINTPDFPDRFNEMVAAHAEASNVDPAMVASEVRSRLATLVGASDINDFGDIEDMVRGIVAREYVVDQFEPQGDQVSADILNKLFRENTLDQWYTPATSDSIKLLELAADQKWSQVGAFIQAADSVESMLGNGGLTFTEYVEKLFREGQLVFSPDHAQVHDAAGRTVFQFNS